MSIPPVVKTHTVKFPDVACQQTFCNRHHRILHPELLSTRGSQSDSRSHNSIVFFWTQKYNGIAVTSILIELALRKSLVLQLVTNEMKPPVYPIDIAWLNYCWFALQISAGSADNSKVVCQLCLCILITTELTPYNNIHCLVWPANWLFGKFILWELGQVGVSVSSDSMVLGCST